MDHQEQHISDHIETVLAGRRMPAECEVFWIGHEDYIALINRQVEITPSLGMLLLDSIGASEVRMLNSHHLYSTILIKGVGDARA